jgi:hypothetical protein
MSYDRGEIYFVHEATGGNAERSPFIKIGLVAFAEGRNSYQRLTEHQTGNPRKLYLKSDQIIETEAVNVVELRLHQIFAQYRVQGEWFDFPTDDLLEKAVTQARALSEEMNQFVPIFKRAEELENENSNGLVKPQTDEDKELLARALEAQMKIKRIEELQDLIMTLLTLAKERGEDIGSVAKTVVKNYKPTFDAKSFKEDNPDVWEKYAVDVEKKDKSFRLKINPKDEHLKDQEFIAQVEELVEILKSIESGDQVDRVNEPNLKLTQLKGAAKWDLEIAKAKLKVSIGQHDEIEGICTWKRATKLVRVLDEERLASEEPDLVKKYVSTPAPKEVIQAKRRKST